MRSNGLRLEDGKCYGTEHGSNSRNEVITLSREDAKTDENIRKDRGKNGSAAGQTESLRLGGFA